MKPDIQYGYIKEKCALPGNIQRIKENRWPVCVTIYDPNHNYYFGNINNIFDEKNNNFFPDFTFGVPKDDIEPISVETYNKRIDEINKPFYIKYKQNIGKYKFKRNGFLKRKLEYVNSKIELATSFSFVRIFEPYVTKEQIIKNTNHANAVFLGSCCALTRDKKTVVTYIPKTWLSYYGYNLQDLKAYINFLSGCGIKFNAEILGVVDLYKEYDKAVKYCWCNPLPSITRIFLKMDEVAYKILIHNTNHPMYNYMNFVFLRYIFNSAYWNIPIIAMKLKKNIPELSNWECLLLAHNAEKYNNGYSLVRRDSDFQLCLPTEENSVENFMERAKSSRDLNSCIKINTYGFRLDTLIFAENYEKIREILKEQKILK